MIRAAHNLLSELQPSWVSARIRLPREPLGLVLLVHNQHPSQQAQVCEQIAGNLVNQQLATCTVGLTHANEHVRGRMILDVESLTERLAGVVTFLQHWDETFGLPLALFGQDMSAAAAIAVAASAPRGLRVVGSFCGRPDLARIQLPMVSVPTLLVVPGRDHEILERNEQAFAALNCPSQIAVIGNATRTLREPGALGACRYLIRRWCDQHFVQRSEVAPAAGSM